MIRPLRIAVVIPALNEEAAIASTLETLRPWRDAGHLVIVADGGSTDRTADIASLLTDRVLHSRPGRARQMNAGADAAGAADAFLFLHADSQLPEGALDAVVAALSSPTYCWGRFDVRITGRSRWLPVVASMMNIRSRLTGIATGDQAIFVTKDAFARAGGFPDWPLMEDIELSQALKRLSRPAALRLRVTTLGRRWDTHGPLRTIALMWWLRLRFFAGTPPDRLAASYAAVR